MAGYKRKVQQWQDAGLISPSQADAIFLWEQDRKSGKFGRGLTGVGIFAILVGVLSIIASNWEVIPAAVKIGAHFLLNIGVAAIAWRAADNARDWVREGATIAFFALTLTLMILIGQVYQLDGTITGLGLAWMATTLPFVWFFGQQRLSAIPWTLSLVFVATAVITEQTGWNDEFWSLFWPIVTSLFIPLGLAAAGATAWLKRVKLAYAEVFAGVGSVLLLILAATSTIYWYAERTSMFTDIAAKAGMSYTDVYLSYGGLFIAALIAIFIHAFLNQFYTGQRERQINAIFITVSIAVASLPFLIPGGESGVISALIFIAYWIFVGWIGQQLAWSKLISAAIVMISIRIFAIYLEVFGTLLDTGMALVIGGAVLLGLIYGARRMNKRLTGREASHG